MLGGWVGIIFCLFEFEFNVGIWFWGIFWYLDICFWDMVGYCEFWFWGREFELYFIGKLWYFWFCVGFWVLLCGIGFNDWDLNCCRGNGLWVGDGRVGFGVGFGLGEE